MTARRGLGQRLGRAFLLQALIISVAGALGVFAASFTLKEILIKRALEQEAAHYWEKAEQQRNFPVPDTRNLRGYIANEDAERPLPSYLHGLDLGFHEVSSPSGRSNPQVDFSVVYVSEKGGTRLFLVFDGESVGDLALVFGLLPLTGVVILLYIAAWVSYRLSRRAVSPIERLVATIQAIDPASTHGISRLFEDLPPHSSQEVVALYEALGALARRVEDSLDRERNFTRDASHELRSPLTVVRMATDILLGDETLSRSNRSSIERIQRAADDMVELTEAFLLLARESDEGLTAQSVDINAVVAHELEVASLTQNPDVRIEMSESCRLRTDASEKVVSVLIGNLVRNAVKYTDEGTVKVTIAPSFVEIEDSGTGMEAGETEKAFRPFFRSPRARRGGFGVGLTIVKRLSDRFDWPLDIESELGVGTRAKVTFPNAVVTPVVPQ